MEYKVKPTKSEHRNKANGNYIVVVNSRLKKRHMLKKFVTVKNLLISNQNEIFIFSTIAKLVIDNKLSDDELALDQTLRIAIGIGADIENAKVKLSALKMSKMQLIGQYIQNGQKLHMRVSRAYVSDMEKKYCRINIDSINVLGTQERKSIIIENAYSEIEQKIKEIYKCYIENNLIGAEQILEEYKNILKNIIIKPEFEYLFVSVMRGATNNNVYSIMNDIFKNKNRMDKRKEIRDLCEYASWEVNADTNLVVCKLNVYATQPETLSSIEKFKSDNNCESIFDRYPDFEKITNISPDISNIYLDKYYRETLKVDLLDNVQIKRNIFDKMKDEIINYGVVFLLTLFTAFIAIDASNASFLFYTFIVSFALTGIIIFIKNKE